MIDEGEDDSALFHLIVATVLVLIAMAISGRAHAHDQWADGSEIPAWIKSSCCGPADAHLLGPDDYWIDRDGFHIKGINAVTPLDKILPSMDGRVWAFYNPGPGPYAPVYCVFYTGAI